MIFELNSVGKCFGDITALRDVTFSADEGDIISIIGSSGAGKTTLLRLLAGLDTADSGTIDFARPNGATHPRILVFQDYVLFPHMTVFENVAFGLRARKEAGRAAIKQSVAEILDYFGISDQSGKYPTGLSGGQKQRVAIARAMIIKPHILLLDEPFANLDRNLKLETADFIRETQKRFGVTTVAVTHDLEEAFAISDKIGILLNGRLVQFGTTEEIYFNPVNIDAARFLGPVNTISASTFRAIADGNPSLETDGCYIARAESLDMTGNSCGNGRVVSRRFTGMAILYLVEVSGASLWVYSLSDSFVPGDRVEVRLKNSQKGKVPQNA